MKKAKISNVKPSGTFPGDQYEQLTTSNPSITVIIVIIVDLYCFVYLLR